MQGRTQDMAAVAAGVLPGAWKKVEGSVALCRTAAGSGYQDRCGRGMHKRSGTDWSWVLQVKLDYQLQGLACHERAAVKAYHPAVLLRPGPVECHFGKPSCAAGRCRACLHRGREHTGAGRFVRLLAVSCSLHIRCTNRQQGSQEQQQLCTAATHELEQRYDQCGQHTCLLYHLGQLHNAMVPQVWHRWHRQVGRQACTMGVRPPCHEHVFQLPNGQGGSDAEWPSSGSAATAVAAAAAAAARCTVDKQLKACMTTHATRGAAGWACALVRIGGGCTKVCMVAALSRTARRRRTTAHVTPAAASTTPAPMATPTAGRLGD